MDGTQLKEKIDIKEDEENNVISKTFSKNSKEDNNVVIERNCTGPCNRFVSDCYTFTIPDGFVFEYPEDFPIDFDFDISNLECIVEPCTVNSPPIPNPCPQDPPIQGCETEIKQVRIIGSIPYIAELKNVVGFNNPFSFFSQGSICTSGSIPVNNIICYTCGETPCPEDLLVGIGLGLKLIPTQDPCGRCVFKGTVELEFNNCSYNGC